MGPNTPPPNENKRNKNTYFRYKMHKHDYKKKYFN